MKTRCVASIAGSMLLLTLASTACAGGAADDGRPGRAPATTVADTIAPAYRIVSLIPAATEILFALGAGDRVVGRTHWDRYPVEAEAVPDVGDGMRPSLETVLARGPDLVLLYRGVANEGVDDRLRGAGVRTLVLEHDTLADLERNILLLGRAAGCAATAARLAHRIRAGLLALASVTRAAHRIPVYYDVWHDPPITIGHGSYLDSLMTLAGARNVFGDMASASPQIGLEAIVFRDPARVVFPRTEDPGSVRVAPIERPGWDGIPAVAAGRIVEVDGDLLHRLGPRILEAATGLAAALHPELDLPAPPEWEASCAA